MTMTHAVRSTSLPGPWTMTHGGASVPLTRRPAASDLSILDIAHHLSIINRWAGATVRPISVAEHSLLVVEILERECAIHQPAVLMAGLLHDAHEAYLGDITTPAKAAIGALAVHHADEPLAQWVLQRFGVALAAQRFASVIKAADQIAARTELRDLIARSLARDQAEREMHSPLCVPVGWIDLRQRDALTWQDWRQAFLDRFDELRAALPPSSASCVATAGQC